MPKGGEIYCHVFENQHTGLARNLFWSITIDFEPVLYGDEDFSCSMTCEWIQWSVRNWHDLDGKKLDADYGEHGIESTFYVTEHDTCKHTKLALRHRRANIFTVKMDMLVNFHGYYGGDADPAMPVHAEVDVPFIGLLINPGSLLPKPTTPAKVQGVASDFMDLSVYEKPESWQGDGFLFRPSIATLAGKTIDLVEAPSLGVGHSVAGAALTSI